MNIYVQVVQNLGTYTGSGGFVGQVLGNSNSPIDPMYWDPGTVYITYDNTGGTFNGNMVYDFGESAFYFPKAYLHAQAMSKRDDLLIAGITFDGKSVSTNGSSVALLVSGSSQALIQSPEDPRAVVYDSTEWAADYTNEQFLALTYAVLDYRQSVIDAEVSVHADIEGDEITDLDGIDSAYATAMADPIERTSLSDLYAKLAQIPGDLSAWLASGVSSGVASAIAAQKGVASGLCPLDSGGKVASTYLPSYVDDVLEYGSLGAFPGTGETGKIYVDTGSNKTYRWSGSVYVEISASPGSTDSVTEGSTNKYFTDARARAAVRHYSETTLKTGSFWITKEATAGASSVVVHLTDDGTSGGAALFPNGPDLKSIQCTAVEGTNLISFGAVTPSNSNKTLTIALSKLASVLGLLTLGQSASGTAVRIAVCGN